jgi:protein-L-isoaspartate(D-aspartate) O-methyltransferase
MQELGIGLSKALRAGHILLAAVAAVIIAGCGPDASPLPTAPIPEERTPSILVSTPLATSDLFLQSRLDMVRLDIEAAGVVDEDVLQAMRRVPRHEFVPAEYLDQAYDNHPLPIGYGQTISQPYIVGWMTELLELQPGEKVLEIGTGSGYQAAVLAEMGFLDVYSIEIVPELAAAAAARLKSLGYDQVHIRQGDGYYGWPEAAPFDAIIVTAAPDHLPAPLATQLAEGGRLVIPIGPAGFYQSLWQFTKKNGELKAYNMGGVSFVPFTGYGIEATPIGTPP